MTSLSISLPETFRFCPRCGHRASQAGGHPFQCEGCDHRHFFNPKCAVAAIIPDDRGQVLMLRRAQDPGKGRLGLPGGFVDPGESLEEAVLREIYEETSLQAAVGRYLGSFPNQYLYRGVTAAVTDTFFICQVPSVDALRPARDEVQAVEFQAPTAACLDDMAFHSNRLAVERFVAQSAGR